MTQAMSIVDDVAPARRPLGDTFPVTHSVCDCEALGQMLTATHGLPKPTTCTFLRRGFHDTYLVSSCSTRYIARVYRAQRSRSEIAYELGLLNHLESRGVPVSTPVLDVAGAWMRTLAAPEGNRCLVLFTHARGRALDWNSDESVLAGTLLATIHRESNDYVSQHARVPLDAAYFIDATLSALKPFLHPTSQETHDLERIADTLRSELEARTPELEWGPCHGDFNGGNIHVSDDQPLTVFDFDFCGPGWRTCDLVGARRWAAWLGVDIWEAFLQAYSSVRRIANADLEAVPLFDGLNRFKRLGLRAANATHRGRLPIVGPKMREHLHSLEAWEKDYGASKRR